MKQILHVAAALIMVLCYSGYLLASLQFCKGYVSISKKKEQLFVIFSLALWLLLNFAAGYVPIPYFILMLLGRLFFAGFVLLFFSGAFGGKILAASLLMAVMTLVQTFCESLLWCLLLFFIHMAGIPYPEQADYLIACVSLGMAAWVVYRLSKRRMALFVCGGGKWRAALAIPLAVLIVIFDMAQLGAANGILLRSGGNLGAFYDQMLSHLGFCVLALLAMFAAGAYVIGLERIFLEQEKGSRYRAQIAVYQMMEEQYSRTERMRHDMKNHILVMSGLYHSKEWKKLGNYLKKMETGCLENSADITGNKAVDALLYQKRRQADQKKIVWECDVQMILTHHIADIQESDSMSLWVLFSGNSRILLLRLIHTVFYYKKKAFLNRLCLNADKAFRRTVRFRMPHPFTCLQRIVQKISEQDTKIKFMDAARFRNLHVALPHDRKKNPQGHGIGLLNVRDVVRQYQGVIHMESEGGIFVISVLIPLDAAAHNMERIV